MYTYRVEREKHVLWELAKRRILSTKHKANTHIVKK